MGFSTTKKSFSEDLVRQLVKIEAINEDNGQNTVLVGQVIDVLGDQMSVRTFGELPKTFSLYQFEEGSARLFIYPQPQEVDFE